MPAGAWASFGEWPFRAHLGERVRLIDGMSGVVGSMGAFEVRRRGMAIVIGFDIHREQITFDALDDVTGELRRGRIAPADRIGFWGVFCRLSHRPTPRGR